MGKITIQLLRKRSEHNDGEIHSLEELALHQEKLEKIELIDKACKSLKILLLQNNAISKIENVSRLKNLEYLNLALNIVHRIENLEGCESLKKLDLTLNFIAELTSVKSLRTLPHFEQLYLVGNPCQDFSGYRDYIVGVLPQLKCLDGRDISQTERIQAIQELDKLEVIIVSQQDKYFAEHENQTKINQPENLLTPAEQTIESTTLTDQDVSTGNINVNADEDDSDFWSKKSIDTPEVRREMIRRIEKQDEQKKPTESKKIKVPRKLTTTDGKPLNINEAKVDFLLNDEWEKSQLVLDLTVPKHMCTTLIDADVQPLHVKVTMKGKIFQLVLPEEVKPDSSCAQRSQTTGHLVITMPKVYDSPTVIFKGTTINEPIDLRNKTGITKSTLPYKQFNQGRTLADENSSKYNAGNKPESVPPLI